MSSESSETSVQVQQLIGCHPERPSQAGTLGPGEPCRIIGLLRFEKTSMIINSTINPSSPCPLNRVPLRSLKNSACCRDLARRAQFLEKLLQNNRKKKNVCVFPLTSPIQMLKVQCWYVKAQCWPVRRRSGIHPYAQVYWVNSKSHTHTKVCNEK